MPGPLPSAGAREALRWLFGRRQRFVVRGRSMLPTLPDGTTVLVERGGHPVEGDVVVARHPFVKELVVVKRVASLHADGRVSLAGDNRAESRHAFGSLPPEAVIGVARSRLSS